MDEYSAYFRLLSAEMRAFLEDRPDTYSEPVSHCDYCPWWTDCEARRRGDDHLGYVAGISRSQIESLRGVSVNRLADLAVLDPVPRPSRGSQAALTRVRDQARVQQLGRDTDQPRHEIKEPLDAEHGFALLPPRLRRMYSSTSKATASPTPAFGSTCSATSWQMTRARSATRRSGRPPPSRSRRTSRSSSTWS